MRNCYCLVFRDVGNVMPFRLETFLLITNPSGQVILVCPQWSVNFDFVAPGMYHCDYPCLDICYRRLHICLPSFALYSHLVKNKAYDRGVKFDPQH